MKGLTNMSKEILFRGKRIDTGEWIVGYYVYDYGHNKHLIFKNELACPNCINDRKKDFSLNYYEVAPSTVCQFTGLTDKNGKKIWENDILMSHGNRDDLSKTVFGEFGVRDVETLEVIDGVIGWHYEVIPTDAVSKCEPFCFPMPLTDYYIKRCEFEVIGNIFDNKELLEVADEI